MMPWEIMGIIAAFVSASVPVLALFYKISLHIGRQTKTLENVVGVLERLETKMESLDNRTHDLDLRISIMERAHKMEVQESSESSH